MKIVGCDFHPSFRQVAILEISSGEVRELKLIHASGEAERFYRELEAPILVGMEAVGNTLWFERLMEQLGHELWIGDAAQIRASYVRRQKTDKRDAGHILRLLVEKRFPRIWVPSSQERDQRQLLLHRHRLVQMRTKVKTELQHLALNQGLQKQRSLWNVRGRADLEKLPLEGWTARRRGDLLAVLAMLEEQVASLDEAVSQVAYSNARARLLMTQPGVGPIIALAFVVTMGDVARFKRGKQVASYLGLIPSERSSGLKRRLGAISKQGNVFLRTMLVEAAQSAVRHDEEFRKGVCASLPPEAERCGQGGRGAQAGGTAVLDAAHPNTVRARSSQRGQPESSCGRRKLDRAFEWAPSHPASGWMFAKRIMVDVTAASMAGGIENSTKSDSQSTRVRLRLQTPGSTRSAQRRRAPFHALDNAFFTAMIRDVWRLRRWSASGGRTNVKGKSGPRLTLNAQIVVDGLAFSRRNWFSDVCSCSCTALAPLRAWSCPLSEAD